MFNRIDNLNKSLVLGYIDPMPGLIAECFVNQREPCEKPGLKAEVWRSFAEVTGFQLIFKKFDDIGFSNAPERPPNATYVLEALANGTINASLALSSMQLHRFEAFRYTLPLYFSQNGLVAGKVVSGPPRPLAVQVFDWYSVLALAIFVLVIGVARGNLWRTFAEYLNKRQRRRTLGDSVLVLFGAFLLVHYNGGMRGEAGMVRKRTRITGEELTEGLNSGTFRINTRDYISADLASQLKLLDRPDQLEIDSLVTYEKDFETISRQLCEDERMIRFEWFGGVNTLIGGRWKSAGCTLEKLEISDSSDLTIRVPSGFALHRDFPRVYRDVLNQIILLQFYGNQLERAMRRYDFTPWTEAKKKKQLLPDSISLHLLSYAFIFYAVACGLTIVAAIVELLTQTTTALDFDSAYKVSTYSPIDFD